MAQVTVDIDLDEFDIDDLVGEVISHKQVSRENHERLTRWLETTPFRDRAAHQRSSASLTERWKIEFFNKNKHRVTLEQLEQFFDSLPIA